MTKVMTLKILSLSDIRNSSLAGLLLSVSLLHAEPLTQPVLERYEQMLVKTPEPGTAFDKVYQHYLESEGLEALAKRWSDAAEKNEANRAEFLLLLGLLNDQRGQTEEALKNLRAAAEGGQNWRAWSALAAVEARAGKLAPAVEDYKKAIALNPPQDALAKLYRGQALCQQRLMDFAGAVETWQNYAKASPGDAFVLEEAGDALLEAGRFDEARTMFAQLREQKDADPARRLTAALRLAEVERQRGGKAAALKIYTEALAEAGASSWLQREVRERIERLFRSDDDLPGLVKYYQERLKTEAGDLEAALRLSETLAELNRHEESLKVLQTGAEKAPDNKDVQLKLASAFLRAERPADAETVLATLAKAFPDDVSVTEKLGEAQWQSFKLGKGSKDTALATWRKLAPDGADANAVQQLAEIFRAHDLTEETLLEYRRALAADPTANDRRERLAEFFMALDRKAEAMAALQGLVADGRASGENYLRLAKIQRRFGDNAAARQSLQEAGDYPDRAFERRYLAWQIATEEKNWEVAEGLAMAMRETAGTEPEFERADECLVEGFRELKKTDAEIRRLLDRQKEAPDAFTERDWRLLFLLAVDGDDNGSAEFALSGGLKQFPKSASLSKLENALARRANDAARRIASLERLEQIEPQRAGDWMAERVRAYRDAERWDDAIKLAQRCVQLAPAKAENHLLLADTFLAAQKQDEAIRALKEAVRLSDNPNQIRLRLAELHAAQGQVVASREAIEEAFEAEETPAGKLQLTGRLASAYLQEGKIDELISKLRARQKAEEGGWRYALYLAEVYQMMQDSVHAMEELDKALAGKPDDPALLKKLMALAEMTGDTEATLRYSRKIAEVEPSKQNRAQLGSALANDGKLDEALGLLKDHSEEFLENPPAWQDVVRALQTEEKTGDLAALLEGRLRAKPNDWRSLMAMAEIFMGAGQTAKAADVLWRVMDITEEATVAPQTSPTPAQSFSGGPFVTAGGWGSRMTYFPPSGASLPASQSRQMRFGETYQRAMQILANNPENARMFGRNVRLGYGGGLAQPGGGTTLTEAQDDAIVYLACLSVRDGSEDAFLKKLSEVLRTRPIEERLALCNLLQSPELSVREIEAFVVSGEKNVKATEAAYQSLQMLMAQRRNNAAIIGVAVSEEKLKALIEKLGTENSAGNQPRHLIQRYSMLIMMGKQEEAEKLAEEILAQPDSDDPLLLATTMQFAITRKNFDRAIALHEKLKAANQKNGATGRQYQNYMLAMALLTSDQHKEKGIDMLAEDFLSATSGAPSARFFGHGMGRQQTAWPQLRGGSLANVLPQPTRELNQQQTGVIRGMAMQNHQLTAVVPDLIKRFSSLAESNNSAALKQAAVWLLWFSGKQKEAESALKALIASKPCDELLLNYSMMLAELKKPAEALQTLDQIQARSGDAYELATRLRFVILLDAKDDKATSAAALKLATLRLIDYEQSQLVQEMKRLGLTAEAAKLEKKAPVSRNPGQRSRQMIEVMNERVRSDQREEALTLAYALLGRDPFSRSMRNERHQQDQALRALKKFGELDNYITKLKTQLDAAPESPRLNAQMAQALQTKEPKLAEPYYRKLAELRPKDAEWMQQLGNLLLQSEQNEEAMRLYDRILAENPALLFSQGTNFVEPYKRTKSWQRLVDAIVKSPDPTMDPLNPYRHNFSHVFMEIGRSVQRARPAVDPTGVWLKGLRWDQSGAWQLRPVLAQALIRAGRTDEARKVVEEAFFPPGRDEGSARLFVYNRQFQPNAIWNQTMSRGSGEVESPALRLMRTAEAMGFLKELLPRIEKIPPPPDGSNPLLMARLVARDETVLPEIRKKMDEAKTAKRGQPMTGGMQPNTWRFLADELANWPEARALAPKALESAAQLSKMNGDDFNSLMAINLQLATLALEDGKMEIAQKALRDWAQAQRDWQRQGAQMDFMSGLRVLKMMAAAGLEKEALSLRDTLRADRNFARNPHYQRTFAQTENEIAINLGKGGSVTAVLAWTPGAGGGGSLFWDLRAGGDTEDDGQTVWMAQEPLRKLSGKYNLEVYFGENEASMKRLMSKPAVAARGSWSGKLPADQGYLRAILRQGDDVLLGPMVSAAAGTPLLAGDSLGAILTAKDGTAKGWTGIPPVPVSLEKGGPAGEGNFLRLDGDQGNQMELTAERIPLDPTKNYLAGGWFRYQQNYGSARMAWRIYDADGKELGQYSPNGNFRGDRWNYAVQRFGQGRNSIDLPKTAAWLEPYVEFSGRCNLQGIFVTEVAVPAKEE